MAPLKIVVTGASTGIGRATALRFSKDGHDVFATARSDAKLSETVKLAKGSAIHKGIGDVCVRADVERNYGEAIKALGGHIDVVVLNAGIGWPLPVEEHSEADYDSIFNTNVKGVFLWLKAVLPAFKKQGFGQIVIINSVGGLAVAGPGFAIYSASKFALTGMAEGLRKEVVGSGIKVASVFPGLVDTPIWSGEKMEAASREKFGVDKGLSPDDVAEAIANVAYQSPRSDIDLVRVWPNYGDKST